MVSIMDAIYKIQTDVLDDMKTKSKLHFTGNVLLKLDYENMVAEKSIVNLCGPSLQ